MYNINNRINNNNTNNINELDINQDILNFNINNDINKCKNFCFVLLITTILLSSGFYLLYYSIESSSEFNSYSETKCKYLSYKISNNYTCCEINNCKCISIITNINCNNYLNNKNKTDICENGPICCEYTYEYNSDDSESYICLNYIKNQLCSVECEDCNNIVITYFLDLYNKKYYINNTIVCKTKNKSCIENVNKNDITCYYNVDNYNDITTDKTIYDNYKRKSDDNITLFIVSLFLISFGVISLIFLIKILKE